MDWGAFRVDKGREVLLYILSKGCRNMYNALKVMYFADKEHMQKAGSTICKGHYFAPEYGAVPSEMYDFFRAVDGQRRDEHSLKEIIRKRPHTGYDYEPLREPDMDFFSDLDIECLDNAIARYGDMSFRDLSSIAHDQPDYKATSLNDTISFKDFVESIDNDGRLMPFLDDILTEVKC